MKPTLPNTSSKEKIARDIADPEQRHLIVEAQIRNGIPLQIRAMREDRGWTQAKLAEKLGTTQNTVSRIENPKTSKPSITTLQRIAEAFDVALIVKFAPFSEFIDSTAGMSPKSVAVPSYKDDKRSSDGQGTGPAQEAGKAPEARQFASSTKLGAHEFLRRFVKQPRFPDIPSQASKLESQLLHIAQ
jgi:transcriptional regulator with XRE-family HTH domain